MLLHSYIFFSLLIQIYFLTIACKGVARSVLIDFKMSLHYYWSKIFQLKLCVPYIQYFIQMSIQIALWDLSSELISPFEKLRICWKGSSLEESFDILWIIIENRNLRGIVLKVDFDALPSLLLTSLASKSCCKEFSCCSFSLEMR